MLAVAGLTFAYTSCTDYSKDIDENKNQIDALGGELATAKQQIESLKTDVSNLQTAKAEAEKAISALQTSLKDLQTKHDADVKALKAEYAAADEAVKADIQKKIDDLDTAHKAEVEKVTKLITSLQDDVKGLDERVKSIEETVKTLASKEEVASAVDAAKIWAQTTFATKDEVKEVSKTVASLSQTFEAAKKLFEQKDSTLAAEIKALETKLQTLEGKHTSDVADLTAKIGEAKTASEAAQTTASEAKAAAATAQATADEALSKAEKALGDVAALKAAFGEYADSGKLAAKIKVLEATDSVNFAKLKDLCDEKLNLADFDTTFTNALKETLEADGIVSAEIAKQINAAKDELNKKIDALKTEVNTKFNALFSVAKQLKSLVFVPELYVDGIEATEYTFAEYNAQNAVKSGKIGEYEESYREYGHGQKDVVAKVPHGYWMYEPVVYDNKHALKGEAINYYVSPASVVTYKMNPSTADVTAATHLALISYDKEYINTKGSDLKPEVVNFVEAKDGELKVELTAESLQQQLEGQKFEVDGERISKEDVIKDYENKWASIFALQATVKGGEGQDTTVTSDFARLYLSPLFFDALAFTSDKYGLQEEDAADVKEKYDCGTQDHIYPTLREAIENAPSVAIRYDEKLNLRNIITTHFTTRKIKHGDYHKVYPDNEYGVDYSFERIDYYAGGNETSETQHILLEGSEVTPCGVTTKDGTSDDNAIGAEAWTSVGRRPIVRVEMKIDDRIVLVGFIKFEIVKQTAYNVADPFEWEFRFHCGGYTNKTTWSQMENNVIKLSGLTKEEFCNTYEIESSGIDPDKHSVAHQYFKVGAGYVRGDKLTAEQMKALKIGVRSFGSVCEVTDAVPGTTTDILSWTIGLDDQSRIYNLANHELTIYVRYKLKSKPITTDYEGIYVPLTAKVIKPASKVSKKLDEYWFNDGKNAKINLEKPNEKASKDNPTAPWETNINNVWEGGKPQFAELDKKYQNGSTIEYKYKYYFAPEQETYEINGLFYKLSVDNTNMYDSVLGKNVKDKVKNIEVPTYELSNNITVASKVKASIYNNNVLYCTIYAKDDNKSLYKDEDGNTYVKKMIATLNQETGVVTYNYEDGADNVAKFLLNAYESDRTTQYAEADLYANIGVTAFVDDCNVAMPLKDAINPYYFLRPINVDAVSGKYFVDGATELQAESNIDLFELFTFKDWYGRVFFKEPASDDDPDYTWLWLFKYYNIKNVEVDLDNVTTDMSGGDITKTKLSEKAPFARLTHLDKSGNNINSGLDLEYNTPMTDKWGENQYKGLREKFGHLHYSNNTSTTSGDFNIRVPVSFTYTWGTINTTVDIQVKATAPSTSL